MNEGYIFTKNFEEIRIFKVLNYLINCIFFFKSDIQLKNECVDVQNPNILACYQNILNPLEAFSQELN